MMIATAITHFYHNHQEQLAHWHPGLTPKVIQDDFVRLSEAEIIVAKRQLLQGIPLAYAVRSRFFYDAEFYINEQVLIPRMESEMILELLEKKWQNRYHILLDIGTGSGCLGLSCAVKFPSLSQVILTDLSASALQVAAINRDKLSYRLPTSCEIKLQCSSCLEKIPHADIIIANPPYIKRSHAPRVHPQVNRYEPHLALFIEDADYFHWYKMFFQQVNLAIHPGGLLVMEGHPEQLPHLFSLLSKYPRVKKIELAQDLTGKVRFLWAEF